MSEKISQKELLMTELTSLAKKMAYVIKNASPEEKEKHNALFKNYINLINVVREEITPISEPLKVSDGLKEINSHDIDSLIVAVGDVDIPFPSNPEDEILGDIFLSFTIDFKVVSLAIYDSNGVLKHEEKLENVFPIELDVKISQLGIPSGVYFVAVSGEEKTDLVAEKVVYIHDESTKAMLYVKISTIAESIYAVIDDLPKLKETTRQKIREFGDAYDKYFIAYSTYLRTNLTTFFVVTSTSPGLSASKDFVNKLVAGASSNRAVLLLKKVGGSAFIERKISGGITAVATALGATAGNAPGAVAGFLVGTAIDIFVNYVLGNFLPNDAEHAIVENQKIITKYLEELETKLQAERSSSQERMDKILKIDDDLVYLSKDIDELVFIFNFYAQGVDFLKKMVVPSNNYLAHTLLKVWVKENAGDDADDGSRYVQDPQWAEGLETLREEYYITGKYGLSNERDLFIFQFEAELERWGMLGTTRALIENLRECVADENLLIEDIQKKYSNKRIWFYAGKEIQNYESFLTFLDKTYDNYYMYGDLNKRLLRESFEKGTLEFSISFNLYIDQNSLFITNFDYELKDDTMDVHTIKEVYSWGENIDNGIKY
jgi:hypothetical protein